MTTSPGTVARPDGTASKTDDPKSSPDKASVFHVNAQQEHALIAEGITRNIKLIIRSNAAKRGWQSRKRMVAARAEQGEKQG